MAFEVYDFTGDHYGVWMHFGMRWHFLICRCIFHGTDWDPICLFFSMGRNLVSLLCPILATNLDPAKAVLEAVSCGDAYWWPKIQGASF